MKSTAAWALLSGLGVLALSARRAPRRLLLFAGGAASAVAVGFGTFLLVPGNAVLSNLTAASTGEDALWRVDRAVNKLAGMLSFGSSASLLLLSAGAGAVVWAVTARRTEPWHVAWGISAVLLLLVLPDRGVDSNHLLDLSILSVVVVGLALAPASRGWSPPVQLALVVGLLAFCSLGVNQYWRPVVLDAARQVTGSAAPVAADPLAGVVPEGASLLSEDPALPTLRGQRPVLTDPFLFRRLSLERPELADELVARLEAHEFDAVVLLDTRPPSFYEELHLGTRVYETILREYPEEQAVPGYVVRRPGA